MCQIFQGAKGSKNVIEKFEVIRLKLYPIRDDFF
jgi:hypothetical protein